MQIDKCRICFHTCDSANPVLLKLEALGVLHEFIGDACYRYDFDSIDKVNEFSNWLDSDECDSWTLVFDCIKDGILYLVIDMF